MTYFCCRSFRIYEQNLSRIGFDDPVATLKSINKMFKKQFQINPFLRYIFPDLSIKSLKNIYKEICILES